MACSVRTGERNTSKKMNDSPRFNYFFYLANYCRMSIFVTPLHKAKALAAGDKKGSANIDN